MSITRDHARAIAKKLGATIEKAGAHQMAYIWYGDTLIAEFGIRHGSNRNQGHGHLKGALSLNQFNVLKLAQCTISKEEWLQILQEKGKLPGGSGGGNGGGEDEDSDEEDESETEDTSASDTEDWIDPPA